MDENMAEQKTDTRGNRIIRVIFAFLFSMPVFFITPFMITGRRATSSEISENYELLLGSNENILANLVVFSFIVCFIACFWYKFKLDRPTSFIFETLGTTFGAFVFVFLTSALLLGVKHSVVFLMQHT